MPLISDLRAQCVHPTAAKMLGEPSGRPQKNDPSRQRSQNKIDTVIVKYVIAIGEKYAITIVILKI